MKIEVDDSKYDHEIFPWYFGNKLLGIIVAYIDDFCFSKSEIFETRVINRIGHVFTVKSEEVSEFQSIGLDIKRRVRILNSERINI